MTIIKGSFAKYTPDVTALVWQQLIALIGGIQVPPYRLHGRFT